MNNGDMDNDAKAAEEQLWDSMENEDLKEFQSIIQRIQQGKISVNWNAERYDATMLQYCCCENLCDFAGSLLEAGCDPNGMTKEREDFPLVIAILYGHSQLVHLLLKYDVYLFRKDIAEQTLLHKVAVRLSSNIPNYLECLRILLKAEFTFVAEQNATKNSRKNRHASNSEQLPMNNRSSHRTKEKIDINARDINGNTALHYATYSGSEEAILLLLRHGASFILENILGEIALYNIKPSTLRAFFDSCIKTEADPNALVKDFSIIFDYSFLASSGTTAKHEGHTDPQIILETEAGHPASTTVKPKGHTDSQIVLETEALWHLSRSAAHQHLLKHPLICSFLMLKWHTIQRYHRFSLFYFFIVTCLFTAALLIHTELNTQLYLMIAAFGLLSTRELFIAVTAWCPYFFTLQNYITIGILICIAIDLGLWSDDFPMSTLALPFIWFKLLLLLGRNPAKSTFTAMFTTVSLTFLRLFLLFASLLIGFGVSFYIILQKAANKAHRTDASDEESKNQSFIMNALKNSSTTSDKSQITNQDGGSNDGFWSSLAFLILKMLAMMTGEIDLGNVPTSNHPVVNRLLFIVLVFFITIVLFNLLNALAISDIQEIQRKAEIVGYIGQIDFIFYMERIVVGQSPAYVDYQYLRTCPVFSYIFKSKYKFPLKRSLCWVSHFTSKKMGHFVRKCCSVRAILLFYTCLRKKQLTFYPYRQSNRLCNKADETRQKGTMCKCHASFHMNRRLVQHIIHSHTKSKSLDRVEDKET